ncbi:MAG: hypothetical protein HRT45_16580 [Bdellovibrionales bacterium]|nr:hypothetical protein [Bdellovibrionales bacterium]
MNRKLIAKVVVASTMLLGPAAFAKAKKFSFSFHDTDLYKITKKYSEYTGEKVVLPTALNKKVNIIAPDKVSPSEAYALLSASLAGEGIAISKRGDTLVLMRARNVQRSWIPVVKQLPPLQPEKMVTYVIRLKHISAQDALKQLRILPSRNGEMVIGSKNEIVMTDWVSNLHRVENIIAELDHK